MSKPAPKDVEMKDVESSIDEKTNSASPKPQPPSPVEELKSNITLIERAVSTLEPRFTHRVLRSLTYLRRRMDANVLRETIAEVYVKGAIINLLRPLRYSKIHRRSHKEDITFMDIDTFGIAG